MSVPGRIATPPLKWHGGKHYLASRFVGLMPPHLHYVEPFLGGGAVLLARDPNDPSLWLSPHKGVSEVVNDINGRLVNFPPFDLTPDNQPCTIAGKARIADPTRPLHHLGEFATVEYRGENNLGIAAIALRRDDTEVVQVFRRVRLRH